MRSALIPPNKLHHLRVAGGRMAFLYVDPLGRDLDALRQRMRGVTPRGAFDLVIEATVIETMARLAEGGLGASEARQTLGLLLGVGKRADTDIRIVAALRRMRDEPHKSHSLTELGANAPACRPPAPASVQGRDGRAAAALPDVESHGGRQWQHSAAEVP